MRAVIQRVSSASVHVHHQKLGAIDAGIVVLLGVGPSDTEEDADYLIKKITQMRIFNDSEGKMNLSLLDIQGNALVISQFTLFAKTKKGNRPSFIGSAAPDMANALYTYFIHALNNIISPPVQSGQFGAHMQVSLVNDGPVTINLDTKNKE